MGSRKIFMQNLKRRMKQLAMSQADLARECFVTRATIWRWIEGINAPTFHNLDTLARALKLKLPDLFKK